MKTTSKKAAAKTAAQNDTTKDFLEWAFFNTMPAAVLCIAKHLIETGNADFEAYLQKWQSNEKAVKDCLNDLNSCGFDAAQAELIRVLSYKPKDNPKIGLPTVDEPDESDENPIVSFFKNLSIREKLIINAFDEILCLGGNMSGGGEKIDDMVKEAIEVDGASIPNDPELKWLLALCQLANAAA